MKSARLNAEKAGIAALPDSSKITLQQTQEEMEELAHIFACIYRCRPKEETARFSLHTEELKAA